MKPAQPNYSLVNGLACLQVLATAGQPVGSRELARRLNLEHTRVNRLLGTLAHIGLAQKTMQKKYEPGPGIHVLAAQSLRASGLLAKALPHLRQLMEQNLIVALGVLWQQYVSYLFHARPGDSFESGIGGFELYPATKSSIGMILLSEKTDRQICETYRNKEVPRYNNSVRALLEDIRKIRRQGFSEVLTHDRSVSVKLGSPGYAAIAFSGKFGKRDVKNYVGILRTAASKIEQDLE